MQRPRPPESLCQLAEAANVDQSQVYIPSAFSPRTRFPITSGGTEQTKLTESPLLQTINAHHTNHIEKEVFTPVCQVQPLTATNVVTCATV
ncbi:hypothetical protein ACTXT7_007963 [Hymenolepis weldensis]